MKANTINLPGVLNARELGGYPAGNRTVRSGVLIRSGVLNKAEPGAIDICHRLPRVATPILTHPLYRSLPEEVLARSESTWLGILTPIQVTYLPLCLFSCQSPIEGIRSLFRGRNICPSTHTEQTRRFFYTLFAGNNEKRPRL